MLRQRRGLRSLESLTTTTPLNDGPITLFLFATLLDPTTRGLVSGAVERFWSLLTVLAVRVAVYSTFVVKVSLSLEIAYSKQETSHVNVSRIREDHGLTSLSCLDSNKVMTGWQVSGISKDAS